MRLYLAVLPPEDITREINQIRKALGETTRNPPHVTLRSSFTTNTYEELVEDLKTIRTPPLTLTFEEYTLFDDEFLVLLARKAPELMGLEAQVVTIAERHRIRETVEREGLDPMQQRYLETYGTPFVFEYYNPHLTLTSTKPEQHDVGRILPFSFRADAISIIEKRDYTIKDRIPLSREP